MCEPACQNGGLCLAPGQCRCRLGFAGASCQLDVDECATGLHRCSANSDCVNMPGWYTCTCKPGFRAPTADTLLGTFCQGQFLSLIDYYHYDYLIIIFKLKNLLLKRNKNKKKNSYNEIMWTEVRFKRRTSPSSGWFFNLFLNSRIYYKIQHVRISSTIVITIMI